jgi:8-oxo-dGTP diphosphatase
MVTVDTVVFGIDEKELQVLLVKRGREPFRDMWALPGGFVDTNETLEEAAVRELHEETGLVVNALYPMKPYSDPERDPRGRNISFAYLSLFLRSEKDVTAGDDAAEVHWYPAKKLPGRPSTTTRWSLMRSTACGSLFSPLTSCSPSCRSRSPE